LELDETGGIPWCSSNGAVLNLNYSGTGSLTVPAATPPLINYPVISGGNLILTGSGGTAGAVFYG
jgi:hypothetical protein